MRAVFNKIKSSYGNLSIQAKAAMWFACCSILQRGIAFITVPIFTRIMSREQYGYYNTYVSWYSILLVFTSLSLYHGVFNNAMIKFKNDRNKYISSMQGLVCTITGIFFFIYLCGRSFFNRLLNMPSMLVLLLFAELLVTPALQFWSAHKRFEFKYRPIVIVTLIKSIANPILGIAMVLLSTNKAFARIISAVIVEVLVCGTIGILQFFRGKTFYFRKYWKYALFFNLPLIPHYLSGQILNQSDRIMISNIVGNREVAMYSVAYSIGLLMNLFTQAINGSFTPWFYQKVAEKDYDKISHVTSSIALFMLLLISGLLLFAPEVIRIVAAPEYKEAVYVIPPVAASVFFIFLYNFFANIEFYFEKNQYVLIGSVGAAIMNIVLNYIFIPRFGYIAAAYTTLFCYILYCFMHYCFAMLVCKQFHVPQTIFNKKLLLSFAGSLVILELLLSFIYRNNYLRYFAIAAVFLILLMNRKKIMLFIDGLLHTVGKSKKIAQYK